MSYSLRIAAYLWSTRCYNFEEMKKRADVLIIDDDPFMLALSNKIVSQLVYRDGIRPFSAAQDAIDSLYPAGAGSTRPGLILCDLHMPGMDGFQFLDAFAKLPAGMRRRFQVFILSSTRDPGDVERLYGKVCFEGLIPKPLNIDKLRQTLRQTGIR